MEPDRFAAARRSSDHDPARDPTLMELLLPLLVVDVALGWMVWTTWRGRQVWMGLDMGSKDDNRAFYWFSLARLGALLLLALVGTVAAWRAM